MADNPTPGGLVLLTKVEARSWIKSFSLESIRFRLTDLLLFRRFEWGTVMSGSINGYLLMVILY